MKKSKNTSNVDEQKKSVGQSASSTKIHKVVSKKQKNQKGTVKEILNNDDVKEETFGIKESEVIKAIKGAIKLHRENPKLQNQLFDERIRLNLQISCHVVPDGPPRIIRIPLPNSPITPDDEICLIVPEVKGIKNIEHEKHVEHYEELLRRKGVDNIKKIMTFHEFRTEHETFEQKLKLVDFYDVFLVDGRISGKVVNKCGKIFYKKRKVPTAVKLQATKLKEQIDNALSKAFFSLHLKGDSYNVQLGHDKMKVQDLAENVFAIIERLDKEFPGGFNNLKGIHISALRSTSVPIYLSFKNPRDVQAIKVTSKKPKAFKTYEGELTTLLNADVVVEPSGKVLVKRTKIEQEEDEDVNDTNSETQETTSENENTAKKSKKRKQKMSEGDVEPANVETEETINENAVKKTKKRKQKISENGEVEPANVQTGENTREKESTSKKTKKRKHKTSEIEVVGQTNVETEETKSEIDNVAKKTKKRKQVAKQNENVEITVEVEEVTTKKIKKIKQNKEKSPKKENIEKGISNGHIAKKNKKNKNSC